GTLPTGATCTDGIQNQGETGIDCGGPCAACPPPTPAAVPTAPDGDTFSIYDGNLPGDNTSYSMNWPYAYEFGAPPTELDLDSGTDVNGAWRFNFGTAGYGQGEGPVDVSTYDTVSFDYYAAPATAGTAGFRFVMINNGAEYNYEIGPGGTDQEPIVVEQWTRVEIPMTYFTGLGFDASAFFQWKFDPYMQSIDNKIYVFVDNILLTRNNALTVDSFDTAEFKVFPNPSNSNWNISSNATISTVKVYDILGKQVSSMTPNSNDVNIDATNFKSGIYFAKIQGETGSKTVKLIRQ
ncbi:MAG: T9SS type A sorting domain-containing protein, partial [Winogradskyella sp.]|nr:T9SS type A sorting domain-containing protein [Winogradskyella sp.]